MDPEIQAMITRVSELALTTTAANVYDRINARKARKQDTQTISDLEEIVNELLDERARPDLDSSRRSSVRNQCDDLIPIWLRSQPRGMVKETPAPRINNLHRTQSDSFFRAGRLIDLGGADREPV